ncbi:arylamine N-acetyltransferase [Alicyclobacillus acidoterrestris]|uniref:arylamine N-acetyltransferase n=1 Tax=Alicyclobacillus acidoterrestris TaxID=1450 RepID=UPI0009DBFE4F
MRKSKKKAVTTSTKSGTRPPKRRGGYCYELNGLLNWLLQTIGFSVSMVIWPCTPRGWNILSRI